MSELIHKKESMKKPFIILILFLGILTVSFALELPLILDKQGAFEILGRTDYTMPDFGFAKPDITANLQKIKDVVSVVRKNQVLTGMKGFDGRARIYTISMLDKDFYGVPARISFEFAAWFRMKDGKEARGLIEPPEWSLYINVMKPGWTIGFSRNPDFFAIPEKKETIEPGIDVYDGECYVIYNPDRPDYWLPVTVKEAFDVVFAENKRNNDNISRDISLKMLNEEWAAIPKVDWNKPATFSGMLSRVGTLTGFPKIMKINPAYWDKNLPKSDIQFIYFRMIGNKKFLQERTKEYLEKNSISYHCARFEESLDIDFVRSLKPFVIK